MKQFRLRLAASLFPVVLTATAFGQSSAPVTLSIRADSTIVSRGTEIRLNIAVQNVSDHPVEIYTASGAGGGRAELDCGVFVRDASGNLLPRADTRTRVLGDGRTITVRDSAFNRKRKTLEPGEKFQDFTILNHLFNLSKPGAYTVVVKKDIPVEGTRPETKLYTATSNTIEITMLASEDTR